MLECRRLTNLDEAEGGVLEDAGYDNVHRLRGEIGSLTPPNATTARPSPRGTLSAGEIATVAASWIYKDARRCLVAVAH